ncbi:MAG: hypothetical protein BYD32DRAFT_430671 [Podila humilis]|nr:MAG: hypothetical protein BYD32DRAFT_430671 [Podila humilis]
MTTRVGEWVKDVPCLPLVSAHRSVSTLTLCPLRINTTLTNGSLLSLSLSFVPLSFSLSLMSVIPGDRTQKKEIGHWIMDRPTDPFFAVCVLSSFFESAIPPFPPLIVSLDYSCLFHTAKRKRALL